MEGGIEGGERREVEGGGGEREEGGMEGGRGRRERKEGEERERREGRREGEEGGRKEEEPTMHVCIELKGIPPEADAPLLMQIGLKNDSIIS